MDDLLKNNIGLQVMTDTGWSNFAGLLIRGKKQTVLLKTQTRNIICTPDHKFYSSKLKIVSASSLKPQNAICTNNGIEKVVSVTLANVEPVYDLLEVEKNHRFYANGILVKNCEFLIYDETLINSTTLVELAGIEPIERQGQVRWYKKPKAGNIYCVAWDPSLGTGGDPAAIQIVELPSMMQVGEWQHNKTSVQRQTRILQEINQYLFDCVGSNSDIYYSIENNTLGEAGLIEISHIGEENIRGYFLSEPIRPGHSRTYRKGFTTTNKSKIAACSKLKNWIETKKLHLASKNIITELKTFVAHGTSFAAKIGETDDLVMAMLLAVRMIQVIQGFDASIDDRLRTQDETIDPLPFIMVS